MATVYRGVKVEEGREDLSAAVKIIHPHVAESPDFLARFRREVAIGSDLIHPNIVTVYSAGSEEGPHFIALELISGSDLRSKMTGEPMPLDKAIAILTPIFRAVSLAHAKGVVHRDLKPENVLVTEKGEVKLSDFGLARSHNFSTVTATGNILGTPAYMAPEQIHGKGAEAADQYALGIMVFELVTGRQPFEADDAMALIMQHLTGTPKVPSSVVSTLPARLDALVAKMLAKDPEARFASVDDALTELRLLL